MTSAATVILVPVLNRPQNVAPLVASIKSATPEPHSILFLASQGDTIEIDAVKLERAQHDDPEYVDLSLTDPARGSWACKINDGFAWTEEPFVFLAADDLAFHDDWLDEALRIMEDTTRGFAKDGRKPLGVVGTNDACNPRTYDPANPAYPHSTHLLVRRSYIDETGGVIDQPPGVVLNEGYPHDFADDELVETAKHRGVYAHADSAVVEHMHPLCGKAEMDETYELGQRVGPTVGAQLYQSRLHLWGGVPARLRASQARRRHRG